MAVHEIRNRYHVTLSLQNNSPQKHGNQSDYTYWNAYGNISGTEPVWKTVTNVFIAGGHIFYP